MSTKLSKKFLSSIAASVTAFCTAPKSNAQTIRYSASYSVSNRNNNNNKIIINNDVDAKALVVTSVGLTAIAAIVIGGVILSNKAYEEKMRKRQDKINTSCLYIKNLAQNLKTVLDDDLFDSLVRCGSNIELRMWQNKVLNYNLSVNDLGKIIDKLYNHWFNCYSYEPFGSRCANIEIQVLRNKHHELVEKKRYEEHMRLLEERNRIEREKLKNMGNNFGVNQNINYNVNVNNNFLGNL